jgi:tight adherence protein B
MNLGIPLEDLFFQYGKEADNEDILEFAGVMEIVKTTGGNLVAILKKTMDNFQRKMDTEEEIRVILSGVVYEKNIMMGMPLIIFAYMRLTNPAYMSCLYETLAGHILVTGVLAGIIACYYWTESMIRIRA